MNKTGPHDGHRQRLKNRFLSSSLDGFEPHQILELLLFFSIPRQDTNEIAHALIDKFGSLSGVFDASFQDLIKVTGIKENSATLIKLIPQIARAYMVDSAPPEKVFDHADKVGRYLVSKYVGETNEVVYAMFLNNAFEHLGFVKLNEGSINSSAINTRAILEKAIECKATMIVLAHNHPSGLPFPSMEDIETTFALHSTLESVGIGLIEHFLIAGDKYFPIIHESLNKSFSDDFPKLTY